MTDTQHNEIQAFQSWQQDDDLPPDWWESERELAQPPKWGRIIATWTVLIIAVVAIWTTIGWGVWKLAIYLKLWGGY